ncbi:hypothetical protein CHLRE_03g172900v5 [Chlamydomonas reinhardtii]|uniref:DUF3172 domain-containing protein n=1 Tax=Chlamydomonas reinhardtii TaxID=3055 RepID=A0A2K3DX72_CHLRE|nr:uncharacterized protein CHLRE_03g172900v5 [Chlamydomonas reinhardtii]PNW85127.1 hypothetical protein CHLRE_03g172900v5 [Chlamydomonas reinhardtii]
MLTGSRVLRAADRQTRTCIVTRAQNEPGRRPPPLPQLPRPQVPPPPLPPRGVYNDYPPYVGQPQHHQYQQPATGPFSQPIGPNSSVKPEDSKAESSLLGGFAQAVVAAAFVVGLGIGTWFDSEVVLTPANVSSTEIIDRAVPNADICMANGYSASVLSMNVFVTYNPFNVYISQPQVKGGCVLRRANVGLLEREQLVTPHDVDLCKQRMNTFAYVGDLKSEPEVACVYHSEEAENQYLEVLGNKSRMSQLLVNQQKQQPAAAAAGAAAGAAAAATQ